MFEMHFDVYVAISQVDRLMRLVGDKNLLRCSENQSQELDRFLFDRVIDAMESERILEEMGRPLYSLLPALLV